MKEGNSRERTNLGAKRFGCTFQPFKLIIINQLRIRATSTVKEVHHKVWRLHIEVQFDNNVITRLYYFDHLIANNNNNLPEHSCQPILVDSS